MTYTCAMLKIPPAAFAEIEARIQRVNQNHDYDHMFMPGHLDIARAK